MFFPSRAPIVGRKITDRPVCPTVCLTRIMVINQTRSACGIWASEVARNNRQFGRENNKHAMEFPRGDEHLLHQFLFVKHRDFFGKRFADLQLITLLDTNRTLDLFVRGTARPGRQSTVIYPNVINFDSVHIYFSRWPSVENLSFRRHNSERNMANKQGGGKPRELPLSNTRKINVLFWGTNQRGKTGRRFSGSGWMNLPVWERLTTSFISTDFLIDTFPDRRGHSRLGGRFGRLFFLVLPGNLLIFVWRWVTNVTVSNKSWSVTLSYE